MSRKHKCIKLTKQEESTLKGMMDKGTQSVRVLKRAEILLHNHRGHEPNEIIRMVDRSMGTVYNIINRYQKEGLKIAINEKPRHGQHRRKIHEKEEAIITSIACSAPPEGRNKWVLRMIADKVVELTSLDSISHETVRGVLKKAN